MSTATASPTIPITPLFEQTPTGPHGRDYLSWSAISTFRQCPLKFHFRYVLGLPESFVSSSLVFGSAIRRAIELHFNELLAGNEPPDLDTLLDAYQEEWRARDEGTFRLGAKETIDDLGRLAERMLKVFQHSPSADPGGRVLGVEEELPAVVPGCPDLLARLDLILETDEAVIVRDFKTSRSHWSPEKLEEAGEQLALYHEVAKELAPGKPLRLQFVVLTKAKQPAVETLDLPMDHHRLRRTKRIVNRVWRAIEAGHAWPNPSPMNCSGCGYRDACRGWPAAAAGDR